MSKTKYPIREAWLIAAVDKLRPEFKKRADVTLPKTVRVSCGFPRGRGGRARAIGQCWSKTCSKDGTTEMFISPELADPVRVLGVLVHELVHAGVGVKEGHNKVFGKAARAMHLEGKLTVTTEGEAFKREISTPIVKALGAYPHAELNPGGEHTGPKKQGTRLLKVYCPQCDYLMRVTAKWLEIATPTCPNEDCDAYQSEMVTP